MKIFKLALREDVKRRVLDNAQSSPLENIFEGQLRIVIPIESNKIRYMVDLLESGETKTKTKYKVNLKEKIAYRFITKNEVEQIDPRPMRLGKVVQKELGPKWNDIWSVESSSEDSESKSIILSRSPIDIARMSDHDQWASCHSPGREYFSHAIDEATEGGAVAYVVENSELNKYIHNLQNEELFKDPDRGIDGISPLSRTRVTRYIDDDENEIGMPVNHTYGEHTSGFVDTLTEFLKEKQSEFIDFDEIDIMDYKRTGGTYADESDRNIITNFFGDSRDVTKDLPHVGGESRLNIWTEEVENMADEINNKLKYCSVHGYVDIYEANDVYVNGHGTVNFQIRGYMSDEGIQWIRNNLSNYNSTLIKEFKFKEWIGGYIDYVDINNKNGVVYISFDIDMTDINTPDDFNAMAEEYIYYEKNYYIDDLIHINEMLISYKALQSTNDTYSFTYEESNDQHSDLAINISTGIDIQHIKSIENFKKYIKNSFEKSLKENVQKVYSEHKNQRTFNFYQHVQDKNNNLIMDINQIQPLYNMSMPDQTKANFDIIIPYSEKYRLGNKYIDAIEKSYNHINKDVINAIYDFIQRENQVSLVKA